MTYNESIPGPWGMRGPGAEVNPKRLLMAMAAGRGRPRGARGGGRGRGPHGGHHGGFPFGFGGGAMPFPDPRVRRLRRAGRGDVRAGILALLAEEPYNGYQIIQELKSRSDGAWRASPGSVYPALQQLEDEGLIEPVQSGGRKAYQLTSEGRTYVDERPEEFEAPWEALADEVDEDIAGLHAVGAQLAAAFAQVAHAGSPGQKQRAVTVLDDARKSLYRILAEDNEPDDATDE